MAGAVAARPDLQAEAAPSRPAASRRDIRLDVFRGLALLLIAVTHMGGNWLVELLPSHFGFSSGTEMFVFCSGIASGLAFGPAVRPARLRPRPGARRSSDLADLLGPYRDVRRRPGHDDLPRHLARQARLLRRPAAGRLPDPSASGDPRARHPDLSATTLRHPADLHRHAGDDPAGDGGTAHRADAALHPRRRRLSLCLDRRHRPAGQSDRPVPALALQPVRLAARFLRRLLHRHEMGAGAGARHALGGRWPRSSCSSPRCR